MDINLVRTFLAIAEVGNFVRAAEQLNVTQSTVSARIKLLEDLLGRPVFRRSKAGAAITPAGARFRPFAEKLVQTWEHARQEVGLPTDFAHILTVGAEFTLWERLLVRWIPWIRNAIPDVAIRTDVGSSDYLMRQLIDGLLDVAVTYTPQHRTGLVIEPLMEEELVLVSTERDAGRPGSETYIYVDWGPEFRLEHTRAFPERGSPVIAVSYGPLALQHMLQNGGCAYLPLRLVRPLIDRARLFVRTDLPSFRRPSYTVYLAGDNPVRFQTAIQGLRYVVSLESDQ